VRFLLAIPLLLALASAGCATSQQKAEKAAAKQETQRKLENSRTVEERRMHALDGTGFSGTKRWAEVAVVDPDKTFDPSRSAVGGRTYDSGKAQTKQFYYGQKDLATTYRAKDYSGSKTAWAGDMKFGTKTAGANTYGTKTAATKTASTNTAWDAGKSAPVKDLSDGKRPYLGPESKKARQNIDPATMADWRTGGSGETMVDTGKTVEKYSTMKQLTIEDIRELLNKNK
jgi:hypothetical protein